jgi:hypothetical protein
LQMLMTYCTYSAPLSLGAVSDAQGRAFAMSDLVSTRYVQHCELAAPKGKDPVCFRKTGSSVNSLTMSYFHTGTRTIIGAEAFHCPVRDGKEWDHLAMVIRLDLSPPSVFTQQPIHRSIRYFS